MPEVRQGLWPTQAGPKPDPGDEKAPEADGEEMILQAGTRGEGITDQVVLVVRFHRPAPDQDWLKRKN
jgi:hypothetical protein